MKDRTYIVSTAATTVLLVAGLVSLDAYGRHNGRAMVLGATEVNGAKLNCIDHRLTAIERKLGIPTTHP